MRHCPAIFVMFLAASPAFSMELVTMNPVDIVAGRRAAYYLSGALVSDMRIAVEGGADPKDQAFAAQSLARWAKSLPRMFPDGSNIPPSRAEPEVWSDRPGFEAKARDYADSADRLVEIALAGDKAQFLAQLIATREKCTACHSTYRLP